jgi:APA family basic amino acid/polyamine antiporter
MSQNSNQQELRKSIGFSAAVSTVVGILIGSGVFFKPQAIYSATNGGPGLGLLAWLMGGLITIAAGLTAAEISASIIKPGGFMVYLEEIYGERVGFLTGWMQVILFVPAIVAALGIIFAQECVSLLGLNNELYIIAIAIGILCCGVVPVIVIVVVIIVVCVTKSKKKKKAAQEAMEAAQMNQNQGHYGGNY